MMGSKKNPYVLQKCLLLLGLLGPYCLTHEVTWVAPEDEICSKVVTRCPWEDSRIDQVFSSSNNLEWLSAIDKCTIGIGRPYWSPIGEWKSNPAARISYENPFEILTPSANENLEALARKATSVWWSSSISGKTLHLLARMKRWKEKFIKGSIILSDHEHLNLKDKMVDEIDRICEQLRYQRELIARVRTISAYNQLWYDEMKTRVKGVLVQRLITDDVDMNTLKSIANCDYVDDTVSNDWRQLFEEVEQETIQRPDHGVEERKKTIDIPSSSKGPSEEEGEGISKFMLQASQIRRIREEQLVILWELFRSYQAGFGITNEEETLILRVEQGVKAPLSRKESETIQRLSKSTNYSRSRGLLINLEKHLFSDQRTQHSVTQRRFRYLVWSLYDKLADGMIFSDDEVGLIDDLLNLDKQSLNPNNLNRLPKSIFNSLVQSQRSKQIRLQEENALSFLETRPKYTMYPGDHLKDLLIEKREKTLRDNRGSDHSKAFLEYKTNSEILVNLAKIYDHKLSQMELFSVKPIEIAWVLPTTSRRVARGESQIPLFDKETIKSLKIKDFEAIQLVFLRNWNHEELRKYVSLVEGTSDAPNSIQYSEALDLVERGYRRNAFDKNRPGFEFLLILKEESKKNKSIFQLEMEKLIKNHQRMHSLKRLIKEKFENHSYFVPPDQVRYQIWEYMRSQFSMGLDKMKRKDTVKIIETEMVF